MPNPILDIPIQLERTRVNTSIVNLTAKVRSTLEFQAKSYLSTSPFRNFLTTPSELKGRVLVKKNGLFEALESTLILTSDNGLSLLTTTSNSLGYFTFINGPTTISENRFKFQILYQNESYLIDVPTTSNGLVGDILLDPIINFSFTKTISGVIKDADNVLTSRRVLAYDRITGILLSETNSNAITGEYSLSVPDREITIVVQDNVSAPVLNDLIARVIP